MGKQRSRGHGRDSVCSPWLSATGTDTLCPTFPTPTLGNRGLPKGRAQLQTAADPWEHTAMASPKAMSHPLDLARLASN